MKPGRENGNSKQEPAIPLAQLRKKIKDLWTKCIKDCEDREGGYTLYGALKTREIHVSSDEEEVRKAAWILS